MNQERDEFLERLKSSHPDIKLLPVQKQLLDGILGNGRVFLSLPIATGKTDVSGVKKTVCRLMNEFLKEREVHEG